MCVVFWSVGIYYQLGTQDTQDKLPAWIIVIVLVIYYATVLMIKYGATTLVVPLADDVCR